MDINKLDKALRLRRQIYDVSKLKSLKSTQVFDYYVTVKLPHSVLEELHKHFIEVVSREEQRLRSEFEGL